MQGASIAQALEQSENGASIATYDISEQNRQDFQNVIGADSEIVIHDNIGAALENADIVMLATPIDTFGQILKDAGAHIMNGAIVTDVGSGKRKAIEEIQSALPKGASYVPAHPIVGKAQIGPKGSDANLFQGKTIVVVPENTPYDAQEAIESLWKAAGAKIAHMNAETHDRLYGTISHFQHLVSFALMGAGEDAIEHYQKSGNTMLDITHFAQGKSPAMWIPIFQDNRDAVLAAGEGFMEQLSELKAALDANDHSSLQALVERAHAFRKAIPEDRKRESIAGEVQDIASEHRVSITNLTEPGSLTAGFNKAANVALVKRTLMPTMIAAALTLNAAQTERDVLDGVKIADVSNLSFEDGSAPMLNNPAYVANLLFANREDVLEQIQAFEKELNSALGLVRTGDGHAIKTYMQHVAELRQTMPPKKISDQMRPAFVFEE